MSEIKTVYFAGKVSKGGGYRGMLLREPRVMSLGNVRYDLDGGSLIYGGPFALSCDHGCFHEEGRHGLLKDTWGGHEFEGYDYGFAEDLPECEHHYPNYPNIAISGISKEKAVTRCLSQIKECDAIHAYVDTNSCYGTLSELGYASALSIPIYIYYKDGAQRWQKHFWFIMNLPNVKHCGPGEPTSIHPDLLTTQKTYKERYHEYLRSEDWNRLRTTKLQEAGYRCQLCNKQGKLSVHHRTYDRVFNEDLADLIALCDSCHKKFHDIRDKGETP